MKLLPGALTADVALIGGGGASYPGAFELARAGLRVALVDDREFLGGECLHSGCVPSKAIREWALKVDEAISTGAKVDPDEVWRRAVDAKDRVQSQVFSQLRWMAEQLSERLTVLRGWATIVSDGELRVRTQEGELTVNFRYLHIGAGSVNVVPRVPGAELCVTSDDLYTYMRTPRELPDSMVIVGGGYIGVEAAEVLSRFGVKVTVVEMMDRLLPNMPMDLSRAALRALQRRGVDVKLGYAASSVERRGQVKVLRATSRDGSSIEVQADEVMMAVGRRPRLEGYGLEVLGLDVGPGIRVSPGMRTSRENVFAAGDVTGKAMLYHAAVRGSLVAARNILVGRDAYRMSYLDVPSVVYTVPEMGYVGYTEEELRAMGVKFDVIRYSMKANSYTLMLGHQDSWVKVLVDESGRVLGAQAFAPEAHAILTAFAMAMGSGLDAERLYWLAPPHPSPMEVLAEAFRQA
ncbi:MAG: dihydrolipoyl dehydrogenase family protein [Acidilobus sp.]